MIMTRSYLLTRTLPFLLALAAVALIALPATAQTGFLKMDGIDGDAKARDHMGWIDVVSVSYDWERAAGPGTGQGRRRASVTYGDVVIVKEIDGSTPMLIDALARGRAIPSALLDVMRGNSVVLKYELTNVAVTSHSIKDGREQVSLSFESIAITHPDSGRETEVNTVTGR
ncbi:hypothetical protein BSZ36_10640 [Rubricoccus marinus]|uniref:Uncharacterized protein n=2 Tax=Rubricoccus marinus TaxID=716817 RepID=A0A259U0M7_9BACT|nr:hypothetical protein BSZ36_10640 [Rubricoccus marinus]